MVISASVTNYYCYLGRRVEESSSEDEEQQLDDGGYIKFKNHRAMKDKLMFNKTKLLQDLSGEHIVRHAGNKLQDINCG